MSQFPCPHCKEAVYGYWDRYKAAKWFILVCQHCGKRACAHPIIIVLFYFFYVWDVVLFGYLTYLKESWVYFSTLVVIWLILDAFSVYIPLSALKSKPVRS